jgi:hypothetical protein
MTIHEFIWPEDRIEHIARHGVTSKQVREAHEEAETAENRFYPGVG